MKISLPWMDREETRILLSTFNKAGKELRFVGGAVRDALLGRGVKDVDIATPASPEAVMKLLRDANIKVVPTGLDHGTVTAVISPAHFEITTLRRDISTDGRHATVAFTDDWFEDASRRDFTINALYATPEGDITDFFGGIEDARAGRVLFIGDAEQRIREDALRILRFFRFFAYYGAPPADTKALAACKSLMEMMNDLSGERIQHEMLKLLEAPDPLPALVLMHHTGLMTYVLPEDMPLQQLGALVKVEAAMKSPPRPLLRLAALLRACNDPEKGVAWVDERWRFSVRQRETLIALVTAPVPHADWEERAQKKFIRRQGNEAAQELALLGWAQAGKQAKQVEKYFKAFLTLARRWHAPEFPVRGQDLMDLGMAPGQEVGDMLREMEKRWEDSDYTLTKRDLLYNKPGG